MGSSKPSSSEIARTWGRLDFVLHSIAYARAEDLHGRLVDCSADGFAFAMQVSVHSFLRMAKLAEPLMASGGCLLAMSYYGADKAVPHYNVMGPVKAALEAAVRYMAVEFGDRHIRVNALSPGPVATRAASGIDHFDELLERAVRRGARAPAGDSRRRRRAGGVSGRATPPRPSPATSAYVDAGYHVLG